MDQPEQPYQEIEALRELLSRLSQASLRINAVPVAWRPWASPSRSST